VIGFGAWLTGCSLVIDVDADCEDNACGAYVCDQDQIACLDRCADSSDCSSGYECASGQCLTLSCSPVFQAAALALPQSIDELAASFANRPAGELDQLFVLVSNRDGLGFRRFEDRGARVPDPPDDAPLVAVVGDNPARRQFYPRVNYFDSTASSQDSGAPRFQYSYVDVRQTSDVVARGELVIDPARAPSSFSLPIGDPIRGQFTNVRFDSTFESTAVIYRDDSGSPRRLLASLSTFDASSGLGDGQVVLSETEESVGVTSVAGVGEQFLAVYSSTAGSQARVRARAFDGDGAATMSVTLESGINAVSQQVARVEIRSIGDGAMAAWLLTDDQGSTLRIQSFSASDISAIRSGAAPSSAPITIETPQGVVTDIRTFARTDEFGVAAVVGAGADQKIWLYRLTPAGQRAARPYQMAEDRLGASPQYSLTDNEAGYGLVWRRDGGIDSEDTAFFQRYVCDGL
jgi:hypothetical protein